jgi:hypothetical protein
MYRVLGAYEPEIRIPGRVGNVAPVAAKAAKPAHLFERTMIIDENLSPQLVKELEARGFKTKTFPKGTPDAEIIKWAQENNAAVLTENASDFMGKEGILVIEVDASLKPNTLTHVLGGRLEALAKADKAHYGYLNSMKWFSLLRESGGPIQLNEINPGGFGAK